jgi:hypothetical protein
LAAPLTRRELIRCRGMVALTAVPPPPWGELNRGGLAYHRRLADHRHHHGARRAQLSGVATPCCHGPKQTGPPEPMAHEQAWHCRPEQQGYHLRAGKEPPLPSPSSRPPSGPDRSAQPDPDEDVRRRRLGERGPTATIKPGGASRQQRGEGGREIGGIARGCFPQLSQDDMRTIRGRGHQATQK